MGHALVYGTVRGYFSTAPTPLDYLAQNINLALKIDQFGIGTSLSNMPYAHSWDGALYTLHYELLSYIVIAILFSAVKKFRFAAVAILFIVSSMAQFFEKFVAAHSSSEVPLLMLHLMPFFFGGSLTYFILQKIPLRWQIAIPSFLFVICIFYFTPIRGWNGAALMSPLITYVALWFSSTFSFGRLGDITRRNDISYGVYIYGFPVQQLLIIIIKTNGIDISASGYIAITFVVVAVFAILSWITVEKKVMDMLKKGSSSAVK
jgi:peptidoglycan/LPS O-acetylase OafA/YrhL